MAVPTTILGQGTYGFVVAPALPNQNPNGTLIRFPGMVTKVFYRQKDYDTLLKSIEEMKETVPSLVIDTIPYASTLNYKMLPSTFRNNISDQLGYKVPNSGRMWIVRMPNLGDSCRKIEKTPDLYRQLRKVPVKTLATQILKCMRVVKSIKDAGYIHGDIRDTNVLCNVFTGTLTIIDFDWFRPAEQFFNEYPKEFFYAHPPESMVLLFPEIQAELGTLMERLGEEAFISEVRHRILEGQFDITTKLRDEFLWVVPDVRHHYIDSLLDFYRELYVMYKYEEFPIQEVFAHVKRDAIQTFDSYGLAVALDWLLSKLKTTIPNEMTKFATFMLDDLLPSMLQPNLYNRIYIEGAILDLENWIRENLPEVQLGETPSTKDELRRLMIQDALLQGKDFESILNSVNANIPQRNQVVALANGTTNVENAERPLLNRPSGGRRRKATKTRRRKSALRKGTRSIKKN